MHLKLILSLYHILKRCTYTCTVRFYYLRRIIDVFRNNYLNVNLNTKISISNDIIFCGGERNFYYCLNVLMVIQDTWTVNSGVVILMLPWLKIKCL